MYTYRINKSVITIFTVVLFSIFILAGCGKKEEATKNESAGNKTEQKTETSNENITENTPIHYVWESAGDVTGTYDVYSKGKLMKINMDVTTHGQKSVSDMYSDGNLIYMITDVSGKKVGMKMDPKKFQKDSESKKEFNPMNFREGCKDCEKIGEEDVIGKHCLIYQDKNGVKYSVYKESIPLKIISKNYTMTAKSLDLNAAFSNDIFTVPKDIEYMDMDKMLDMKDLKNSKDLKEEMKKMEDVMKNYKK
jgi:hypothetical protein